MPNETRAFTSFMDFALGVDSVSGDIRGQAVTRIPAAPVPNADGQTVMFHVQSVTSSADVKKGFCRNKSMQLNSIQNWFRFSGPGSKTCRRAGFTLADRLISACHRLGFLSHERFLRPVHSAA